MKISNSIVMVFAAFGTVGVSSATTYDVITDWNAVSTAQYADGTEDLTADRGWACPDAGAAVSKGVAVVDMNDAEEALGYAPSDPISTNAFETAYVALTNVTAGRIEMDEKIDGQAALCAATSGGVTSWYGYNGGDDPGWKALTGATPAAGSPCVVRVDFDNRGDVKLVRYAVKQGDAADFTVLSAAGNVEWLTNGLASVSRVNGVAFDGVAAFTDIKFTQTGTVTSTDTFEARMKEQDVSEAELNDTATNGNSNWENIVLGLDGNDEESKPVVLPVQTTNPTKVTLRLGGINVDTGAGATVKYKIVESDSPGGEGTETDLVNYTKDTAVDLPESGVRYYRMQVITSPAN